ASSEVVANVSSGGSTGSVALTWTAQAGATGYRIYRGTSPGGEDHYQSVGVVTSFTDTGSAGTAEAAPLRVPVLPLVVGTRSFRRPITDRVSGGGGLAGENTLGIKVGVVGATLFSAPGNAFSLKVTKPPDWSHFSPTPPGIFALLSDPAT